MSVRIVALEFFFNQVIEVRKDGIVLWAHPAEVGALGDAELVIQLGQHDLDGVDVCVAEILVGPEKVLEEGNMLRELGGLAKGLGWIKFRFM